MATSSGKDHTLRNVTMYWVKCSKDKPEPAFGTSGPKWSIEIRTKSKEQSAEWKALGINVKLTEGDDGVFYRASLRKQTHKKDGTPYAPVVFVNGQLEEVDPATVANGSVGNIRIWTNPFELKDPKTGAILKSGTAVMLMKVQLVKHVVYVRTERQEFEMIDTEVVNPTNKHAEPDEPDDANF